jgi:hypothetical protein
MSCALCSGCFPCTLRVRTIWVLHQHDHLTMTLTTLRYTRDDLAKCDADGGCSCVLIFRNYHTDNGYKPFNVPSYTDGQ